MIFFRLTLLFVYLLGISVLAMEASGSSFSVENGQCITLDRRRIFLIKCADSPNQQLRMTLITRGFGLFHSSSDKNRMICYDLIKRRFTVRKAEDFVKLRHIRKMRRRKRRVINSRRKVKRILNNAAKEDLECGFYEASHGNGYTSFYVMWRGKPTYLAFKKQSGKMRPNRAKPVSVSKLKEQYAKYHSQFIKRTGKEDL